MGQSTNAIIAFGFDLGEEGDLPASLQKLLEEHDHEIDEMLAAEAGTPLPEYTDFPEYKNYQAAKDAILNAIPYDLVRHCSGDYPMYFLALRGTMAKALRGTPKKVDMDALPMSELLSKLPAIPAFCERHGIELKDPAWYIFSMWN